MKQGHNWLLIKCVPSSMKGHNKNIQSCFNWASPISFFLESIQGNLRINMHKKRKKKVFHFPTLAVGSFKLYQHKLIFIFEKDTCIVRLKDKNILLSYNMPKNVFPEQEKRILFPIIKT